MAQQRIMIDSRDRVQGSSIQCATYVLDKPVQNVTCCRLDFAQIFNTFYNVDSDTIVVDSTVKVISPGFYTNEELVQAIDVLLKQVDPALGATYSTITGFCTWNMGSHVLNLGSARHLIGLDEQQTGVFQTIINTSNPLSIQIMIPECSGADSQRSTNRNSIDMTPIATIPIYSSHNELNFFQPMYPSIISCQSTSLQRFTIQLMDSNGMKLSNITDYQIHLTMF
jgi:hypothetical protein